MATEEERQAYERGRAEGEIRERLDSHDRHFQTINGQLERVAKSLTEMTVAVTRMDDKQQAIINTTGATQEALRAASDRRWNVWQRIFAVVGMVATLAGMYVAWRTLH